MDEIGRYNKERWEELAEAGVVYARPALDLDEGSARELVDPEDVLGDVAGREVLCLAGGGGQQSVAFALLGAEVMVLDFSEMQLKRDREAAAYYGVQVTTCRGDMRDLSRFPDGSFDVVWHAHSLNFVPDPGPVFREVACVLRPEGLYRLQCWNPFAHGLDAESWTGEGYVLKRPYVDGAEVIHEDPYWGFEDEAGRCQRIKGPHEFRHVLSTLVNGLVGLGFVMLGVWEDETGDPDAEPGTWEHFKSVASPWLTFWASYRPDVFESVED